MNNKEKDACKLFEDTGPLMASHPSLVTPSGWFEMQDSSKFPSAKIPRFVSSGLIEIQVGGEVNNGVVHNQGSLTSPGPAHTTSNFAPNEYRGVVNPSGLAVYKGSTQEIMIVVTATESKLRV